MKLGQSFFVGDDKVVKCASFGGIDVYSVIGTNDAMDIMYFINSKGTIVQKLVIEADCGQNQGYIAQCEFIDVK